MTRPRTVLLSKAIILLAMISQTAPSRAAAPLPTLTQEQASAFARLALANVRGNTRISRTTSLTARPTSSGHGRFTRRFTAASTGTRRPWPLDARAVAATISDLPEQADIRAVLDQAPCPPRTSCKEADYFAEPNRQSFERALRLDVVAEACWRRTNCTDGTMPTASGGSQNLRTARDGT